jgi:hypothetical protein
MFGYLLLYQWATEDPPRPVVIVKRGFRSKPTLLTTTGCFELDAKSLADQLSRREVRYVTFWTFWWHVEAELVHNCCSATPVCESLSNVVPGVKGLGQNSIQERSY